MKNDEAMKCCRCGEIRGDGGDRLRLQRECENFDICAKCKDYFYKEFTRKETKEPELTHDGSTIIMGQTPDDDEEEEEQPKKKVGRPKKHGK